MTNIPLEEYQISYCNLSPDAEKLYFFTDSPLRSLYVVNSNGSELVQISDRQYFDYGTAKFSPNGKSIAYFEPSFFSQFAAKLFISNTAGTYKKIIIDSLNSRAGVALDWSPNGSRIVYHDFSFDLQVAKICVIDTAKNNYSELAHGYFPAWSPKGDKICFENFIGSRSDIFLMNQDGTNISNITNSTTADESNFKWSKDGMKILYISYGSAHSPEVWIYDVNSNSNTLLADSVYDAVWQ